MAKKNNFFDLDKLASGLLNLLDPNIANKERISTKAQRMQSILNKEIDISKGVSDGNIIEFDMAIRKDAKRGQGTNKESDVNIDPRKLVTENLGDIFSIYRENYKNKYLEIQDLKFVCKIIPALGEAVRATLNSMCCSDNISSILNRKIDLPSALTDSEKTSVINYIESFEKDNKLKKLLKNQAINNGLMLGTQYMYVKPYSEIFNEYEVIRSKSTEKDRPTEKDTLNLGNRKHKAAYLQTAEENLRNSTFATEAYLNIGMGHTICMEGCIDTGKIMSELSFTDADIKKDFEASKNHLSNFFILDSGIPAPVLESVGSVKSFSENFEKTVDSTTNQFVQLYAEGAVDEKAKKHKQENFDSETGVYIKLLDYKNIIPYNPMGKTLGYFYIHCDKKKLKENLSNSRGFGALSSLNTEQMRKDKMVDDIVTSMTNQILDKFNKKFIADHSEFKKLIADCIITNGFVDQDYKIQFIPANDVIEFKFNEDENGDGRSMLIDSLCPAVLLSSLMVAKHMNYINSAGDKTLITTHKGATTIQTGNRVEQTVRDMQLGDVNFADYSSSSLLFSKLSRNSKFHIPTGKSGNKLIEVEKWEPTQVDMNTEYEIYLHRMVILGTGVPSTILEYIDAADYAKQIESANIRYAQFVAGLQGDVVDPLTKLYRTIVIHSTLPDNIKQIIATSDEFEVSLPIPKVLASTNNADSYNTIKSLAEQIADTVMLIDDGNSLDDKTSKMIRSKIIAKIMNEEAPHINWELYLKFYSEARIEVEKNIDETKDNPDDSQM